MPISELIRRIEEAHSAIAHHFFTGIGHYAQFIESEIMVEVLLRLKREHVVALPIHDAIMVRRSAAEAAEITMAGVFRERVGLDAVIRREGL